jgi:hypothetical protein
MRGRFGDGVYGSGNLVGARAEASVPNCQGTVFPVVVVGLKLLSFAIWT